MLSDKLKARVRVAITTKDLAEELIAAINAGANAQAAHVASVATADATDLPSAIALANSNKAKMNELLAALQAAGLMA